MARHSSLHDVFLQAQATFTDWNGWEVPDHFGDPAQEYFQARKGAAVFDMSVRGKLDLTEPDAVTFLQNLCTNDIKNLPIRGGCEAFLTTNKARVVAQFFVSRLKGENGDLLRLDTVPGMVESVQKHLDHYLISEQVEISDCTQDWALLFLCGPQALAILENVGASSAGDLTHLSQAEFSLADTPCFIRRNDYLGLTGFDLFCPADAATKVWKLLTEQGATPAGFQAFEVLRIEAGYPLFGKDIGEDRLVMEVGRTKQAISYTKGCFLGQEPIVMSRDRGHVNRILMGLQIGDEGTVPSKSKIFHEGQEVGQVTSSTFSPGLKTTIALGYLKRNCQTPGTEVDIETPEGLKKGIIAAIPLEIPEPIEPGQS